MERYPTIMTFFISLSILILLGVWYLPPNVPYVKNKSDKTDLSHTEAEGIILNFDPSIAYYKRVEQVILRKRSNMIFVEKDSILKETVKYFHYVN